MSLTQRKNTKREAEVQNILRQKYPNGVDKPVILKYAQLAARVLKEGKVPFSSADERCWELYHYYEKDMYPNDRVEEREDTDSYRLMDDGRLIFKSTRELWFRSPNPMPYNFKHYEKYDRERKEFSPSERDLIQIDLLLEENHIKGVLEAFLKDGGKNYRVNQDDPYVVKRIQEQKERKADAKKNKRKATGFKARQKGKTALLVVAWIVFWYFIYRFGRGLIINRDELMMSVGQYLLFGSTAVGLLNFAQLLRSNNRRGILIFTVLSSVIICFIFAVAVYHFGNFTQTYFWQNYLPLILRFIIFIVIGQIAGNAIRRSRNK